jgi:hypothetical protein
MAHSLTGRKKAKAERIRTMKKKTYGPTDTGTAEILQHFVIQHGNHYSGGKDRDHA